MSANTILSKMRNQVKSSKSLESRFPDTVRTNYTSLPVSIPPDFLGPLADTSKPTVSRIDFANSPLPEYKSFYAVVLDNVLSAQECQELIHMAEQSAGAHGNGPEKSVENNGWRPAMVNAGYNFEVLSLEYRNSDRIIWDNQEIAHRLWLRVLQGEGMKEYFEEMEGEEYAPVIGPRSVKLGERWAVAEKGLNERLRFLKYGEGQFFREHCDGTYETPDGAFRSFFTLHLYLNDSAQALGIPDSDTEGGKDPANGMLRGGSTPFFSQRMEGRRVDIDPKAGRVLIFQHKGLLHSGDLVTAGIKYTMRTDLMYGMAGSSADGADGVDIEFG
ncbi:Uncharacterized protein BP5553_00820 [Venustampulla echinocandica]|uniref:Prolyl 4-hydroxylase alpha subunit domain-containing protein n=1 Tax=Venustampulla echinocandica TaxID=2656787 RepID=A0A370TZ80_9HELO|nr:Uncharacterized protein BP5553_00820 [Venustampulla echinocandica]RDL40841.1 Uncharacterized protein BP5553_00820 [Venustampulla echinocandica]